MSKKVRRLNCRYCESIGLSLVLERGDYEIYKCDRCDFFQLEPLPKQKELRKIYNCDNYLGDKLELEYAGDAKKRIELVKNFMVEKGVVLDYGCGTGDFLDLAKQEGYQVVGYDLSSLQADLVKKNATLKWCR